MRVPVLVPVVPVLVPVEPVPVDPVVEPVPVREPAPLVAPLTAPVRLVPLVPPLPVPVLPLIPPLIPSTPLPLRQKFLRLQHDTTVVRPVLTGATHRRTQPEVWTFVAADKLRIRCETQPQML